MPLGVAVGLVPCHIVLDGDPAPTSPTETGTAVPTSQHMSISGHWSPMSATAELLFLCRTYSTAWREAFLPSGISLYGEVMRNSEIFSMVGVHALTKRATGLYKHAPIFAKPLTSPVPRLSILKVGRRPLLPKDTRAKFTGGRV